MAQIVRAIVLIFTALFPIVNPMGGAPIFLSLTHDCTPVQRRTLAWRVALYSFFMLMGSILIGSRVLALFGVSLPIVQVGGGLVVISVGWAMLKHEDEEERKEIHRTANAGVPLHKAFYPLTMPLTVGPGSIATAITLGANAPHPGGGRLLLALLEAIIGSLLLALYVFICYAFSDRSGKLLGPAAMNVVTRLSAFLLTCIGLQIAWNGISALIHTL
ncbi:MAG: MarC family protein [Terracidiphilus sp.]|jgi:multiple antibiotic resistance protein